MAIVGPDRYNELKARVKAECLRRCNVGDISKYAGPEYDYTIVPANGTSVLHEHRNKIVVPLNAINSDVIKLDPQYIISEEDLLILEAFITSLESRTKEDNNSDCNASCTGLCSSSCSGSCSGGCSGNCDGDCEGGCDAVCAHSCSGDCEGGCDDDCSYGCYHDCLASCDDECANSCVAAASGRA